MRLAVMGLATALAVTTCTACTAALATVAKPVPRVTHVQFGPKVYGDWAEFFRDSMPVWRERAKQGPRCHRLFRCPMNERSRT